MSDLSSIFRSSMSNVRDFFYDAFEGATAGDLSSKQSAGKTVGQIGGGLIPIYGQIADARDTTAALEKTVNGKEGGVRDLLFSLIGWIPLFGDGIKSTYRSAGGLLRKTDDLPSGMFRGGKYTEEGQLSRFTYKPTVEVDYRAPVGYGETDKYGNVMYSGRGSKVDQALAYHHEMVHSFLSPKLEVLREFRADIRMAGYTKSSFLRYLEEALAETYAQLRVNGVSADSLFKGISFPIKNDYVRLEDVVREGAIGSVAVGGTLYGVYLASSDGE